MSENRQPQMSQEERRRRMEAFRQARLQGESLSGNEVDEEAGQTEQIRRKRSKRDQAREKLKIELQLKKRRRAVLLVMTEMVVFLVLCIACYGVTVLKSYDYEELSDDIYRETTTAKRDAEATNDSGEVIIVDDDDEQTTSRTGYRNILVLGLDKGDEGNAYGYDDEGRNSDVIMIISINNDTGEIRMASIMRDLIVKLEDGTYYPYGKANDQYAESGLNDTVSMINRNFGLDIDEYVTINWYSVATLIDQMGGVELTIPNEEVLQYFNGYLTEVVDTIGIWGQQYTEPGTYLMNGSQAVAFCRIRYAGYNDDGRTNNQREVITKLFEKAKQMAKDGDLATLIQVAKTALGNVKTSLNFAEVVHLASEIGSYSMGGSIKIPSDYESETYLGSYYSKYHIVDPVVATDFEGEVKSLHQFLFDDSDYEPSDFIKKISDQMYKDRKGLD